MSFSFFAFGSWLVDDAEAEEAGRLGVEIGLVEDGDLGAGWGDGIFGDGGGAGEGVALGARCDGGRANKGSSEKSNALVRK